ncbi:MAG: nucleotidyl transferase AbiEii/AbiGii toxin family protein [Hyphomicrobiales bacterium]|nr:nucleotidyl transferase AbiEii/AbiGii toxin family protein [Hyphomicrobiales bacterium]
MSAVISSPWQRLLPVAYELIDQVNHAYPLIDNWTFGGGTAMLLQINHRESHDIDLFLSDPQQLSLFNPETTAFNLSIQPSGYSSNGTTSCRFAFDDIGEIDFIVAAHITDEPTTGQQVCGREVQLETVPEIIAKKVHSRGDSMQPRDLFDIASGAMAGHRDAIIEALSSMPQEVEVAIAAAEKLKPEFVKALFSRYMIKHDFRQLQNTYREQALEIMRETLCWS